MDLQLSGKTAVVFGGSRGLGRAIAAELVQEGVKVVIIARDADRVQRTATEIGCLGLPGDLSAPGAGTALMHQAAGLLGRMPDILVTNTGGPPTGSFAATNATAWQTGFQGLWLSAVDAIQAALPAMQANRWGRILAVTSVAAKEPQPGLVISNALRAGLLGMVNTLSREVAADGITVNALLPGYTNTDRMAELGVDNASMGPKIPAGRLGEPAEFAALAAFLASGRASYITGQAIAVDGGFLHSI
ncbi:oxidoreductase [Cypionkella aquatica]|uniref:Oxidoreductase n=1 Tax=Cypionkella aquatica TaxID=1756042 RepID=A0AA37WZH6_9RHOB|nr:SDR family oxidoreductase [Cypionkella aquatica]GLS86207.1 oxidoreductase [Cypionkella aquatica]